MDKQADQQVDLKAALLLLGKDWSSLAHHLQALEHDVTTPCSRLSLRLTEAIKKLLDDDGVTVSNYQFQLAWKLNDLKNPTKGLAVQLGGQWFWYQEGIDKIREIVTA